MERFYSSRPVPTYRHTVVAVADELLCQIETGLRYPLRAKSTFKIKTSIYLPEKHLFDNKKLDDILKASHFYKPCWHTRIVSPHGDKNIIADAMTVVLKVRKRRGDTRYEIRDGVLQSVKPFRGLEVVAHLQRKRQ